jgi:hypothetical protein
MTWPRAAISAAFVAALSLLSMPVRAADGSEEGTFSILFENDIFDSTDRDYTNGIELAYTGAPQDTPGWAVDFARWLPFFADSGDVRARYALGQSMFTPTDLTRADPSPTDRPYAGFLYGALGLANDTEARLDQLQLTLGVIGPDSQGGQTQRYVHSLINNPLPQGWGYQLHNEPGLILQYERSDKVIPPTSLLGLIVDVEPHYGGAIGNVYDYVNVGAMARLGFNLPKDYGPMRIDPSSPGSNYFEPTAGFGAYLFAGVDGRAVARNLFLDGNTFEASRSVDKKDFVGDVILGAAVVFRSFRIAFTHVIRSPEFTTQPRKDEFGAVDLSCRF